jgi:hypothetical protein
MNVPVRPRQVFAFSGVLNRPPGEPSDPAFLEYAVTTEGGVGLHYIGTELHEAVAMVDGARAWWVEPSGDGGYRDEPIPPRRL